MAALAPGEAPRNGVIGTLAIVALTLVLAFQLAHWTWVFIAPPQVATTPAGDAGVDMAAIAKLFGAAPPSSATVASSSGLRLKGVVAPDGGPIASAIFSTGSGRFLRTRTQKQGCGNCEESDFHTGSETDLLPRNNWAICLRNISRCF